MSSRPREAIVELLSVLFLVSLVRARWLPGERVETLAEVRVRLLPRPASPDHPDQVQVQMKQSAELPASAMAAAQSHQRRQAPPRVAPAQLPQARSLEAEEFQVEVVEAQPLRE